MDKTNIKGLYKGIDEEGKYTYYFTLTSDELNQLKKEESELLVDNHKHVMVSIDPENLELITEDQDFIEKVERYKMTTQYEL